MFGGRNLINDIMDQQELRRMISNEAEDTSGRTAAEIERVVYARVTSFDFLERAMGAERQEQWSIKIPKTDENAGSGSIRVRKVTNLREPGAAVQFILTSKLDIGKMGNCAETSEQSSADQFNIFKYMANKGMMKDRYTFAIEGSDRVWEVDCFQKPGALYFEWIKIDLEDWPAGKELPQLPFATAETVDGDKTNQTEETKAKISRLYEEIFLMKNTNTPLGVPEGEEEPEVPRSENEQPGVAGDTGEKAPGTETQPDHSADDEAIKAEGGEGDDANAGDKPDGDKKPEDKEGFADGVGDATVEAFSSFGQVAIRLIPILGPLIARVQGGRSTDMGVSQTKQYTNKTESHVDKNGRKVSHSTGTGSFLLSDIPDAKDYIGTIEHSIKEVINKSKNIDRIDLSLWPQKDGRYDLFNISTDRDGTTRVITKNNPGSLKWFSMSLAGKRLIRLNGPDVSSLKFNGRTISCPFNGEIVEFDVGQLRHVKYQTKPVDSAFDIVEYNFDA